MYLSLAQVASRWVSTGLKRSQWTVSTPHWKVRVGTALPRVHSWAASPQVANCPRVFDLRGVVLCDPSFPKLLS